MMEHVPEIPRNSTSRTMRMASIPLGMAGRAAVGLGKRIAGGDRAEIDAQLSAQAAEQMFTVLGELKGGAMKLGQTLSVMEAAIPEEYAEPYRESLAKLQAGAPPMPTRDVHRVLTKQLGSGWRKRFRDFDDTPVASASIGQVHRGIWSDGREVAVKVQYPGADEALRSDLKTLARFTGILGTISPGLDVRAIIDEFNSRTEEELDYRLEANNQRAFAKVFRDDPKFAVPRVVASSPKVMVSEWLSATPLALIIAGGSEEQRNTSGTRLAEFALESPARVGILHADPHPGNFMLLADGRLGVLDFGAAAPMPDGLPPILGRVVRLAVEERYDELSDLMKANNFVGPGRTVGEREIADYLRPFTDPLHSEYFHFTRAWMQGAAGTAADFNSAQFRTGRNLNLPREHLMVFRVLLGSVGICAQLGAYAPYMRILTQWLPGFGDNEVPKPPKPDEA
jgi:predicted unusual protein kinase regulating ubiquinone biosynthesis (AarF/ABC1/UbiB family)